jgi:hypothetical protein
LVAYLLYVAGEHAAGAGYRVLHLAAGGDDLQHGPADLVRIVPVGFADLAVGGGVQVEAVHPDADLVGGDGRAGVEAPGGLGQHARRLYHPVQAEG